MNMQRDTSPRSAPLAFCIFMMILALVTNWEPHGVTLTGYCTTMRHGVKGQIVTLYRVSHSQRYGVVDVDVDVEWDRGHGATTPSHLGL
jgi:hypothetical protein